jgi:hypothetical protein
MPQPSHPFTSGPLSSVSDKQHQRKGSSSSPQLPGSVLHLAPLLVLLVSLAAFQSAAMQVLIGIALGIAAALGLAAISELMGLLFSKTRQRDRPP